MNTTLMFLNCLKNILTDDYIVRFLYRQSMVYSVPLKVVMHLPTSSKEPTFPDGTTP